MAQLNRALIIEPHPARIIGFVGGKPVREIRGGSQPLPEGGGQGGQTDPPADPDLIGGAGGQTDPPAGGTTDPIPTGEQAPAWLAAFAQQQQAAFQSEMDRRIGQIVNGRRNGQGQGGQGQGQGGQGGGQQDPPANQPRGLDDRDLRDARSEFRDILRDSTFSLTAGEREFVNAISTGVVTAALARTGDPFEAATQAAGVVTEQIRKLRTSHQAEMMTRLRGLGAVDETKLRPGSSQQSATRPGYTPAGGQQNVGEQFTGGVNKAAELAGRRGLATPGSTQPGQK